MDWYPLFNSLRIALISTFFTFFLGIFAAWYHRHLSADVPHGTRRL